MSSVIQFRIACEECHERKIRCKQSNKEGVGSGSCQACYSNGRKCLFSLKSKTGRPKIAQSFSSVSSIPTLPQSFPSGSLSLPHLSFSAGSSPNATPRMIGDRKSNGGPKSTADAQMQFNFNFNQSQTISEFLSEKPLSIPSALSPNMSNNQFWQPNGEHEGESGPPGSGGSAFQMEHNFQQPSPKSPSVVPTTVMKDSPHRGVISPFINHFKNMPPGKDTGGQQQGNTTLPNQPGNPTQRNRNRSPTRSLDIPQKIKHSQTDQLSETSTELGNSNSASVFEFLRALEFSHELRWHFEPMPGRSLSLLAVEDAEDVRTLLDSLDRLCTKIAAVIPTALHNSSETDRSTYILVFAAVMEVIDQTIRRLGCLVELEPRFDPGLSKPDSLFCSDFDMEMNSLVYSGTQDHSSFLPHSFNPDSMSGGMMHTEVAMDVPHIEIEHLLSLTRLDYYLLRFKSFISHFDSSPDLLGATTFMFSPSGSMAQLLSFHRCIEGIQSGWRARWCK